MTIEEAIKTAMEYESRVHSVYLDAAKQTDHPTGMRVFQALADEEQRHLEYLQSKLDEWIQTGRVTFEKLDSIIPPPHVIQNAVKNLAPTISVKDPSTEEELLEKALDFEIQTSNFFKEMLGKLPSEMRKIFARFIEIEEGHVQIVKAEIDAVSGMGFWFDFQEFNLEVE